MDKVIKSMNKSQLALMCGMGVKTFTRWMKSDSELSLIATKRGTGTYLYTENEIRLIIDKYKGKVS